MKESSKYLLGLSPICIGGFLGIFGVIILVALLEKEVSKNNNYETIKENTVSSNNEESLNSNTDNNSSRLESKNDNQTYKKLTFKEFANEFLLYGTEGVDNFESYSESKINYIEDANAINTKTTPEFVFTKIRSDFKELKPYIGKGFISFSYDGNKIITYLDECNTCFFREDDRGNWKIYKVKKGIECPE